MRPRRPDSRTYAQVAVDDTEATTEGNSTLGRSADRVNARGQMPRENRHRDGDSPRAKPNSGGERHTGARANCGGVRAEFGHRQSGNKSEDSNPYPAALSGPDDVRTGRTTHVS